MIDSLSASPDPLAGRLRPKWNAKGQTTITAALGFLNKHHANLEDDKVTKVKVAVAKVAQRITYESGLPDYLLDEAVNDMIKELEALEARLVNRGLDRLLTETSRVILMAGGEACETCNMLIVVDMCLL